MEEAHQIAKEAGEKLSEARELRDKNSEIPVEKINTIIGELEHVAEETVNAAYIVDKSLSKAALRIKKTWFKSQKI